MSIKTKGILYFLPGYTINSEVMKFAMVHGMRGMRGGDEMMEINT